MLLPGRLAEWSPSFVLDEKYECGSQSWTSLAAWAVSTGMRYTGRPFYELAAVTLQPSVVEITYLAKSIRRRILHRLDSNLA